MPQNDFAGTFPRETLSSLTLALLMAAGGCATADAGGALVTDTASWHVADQPRVLIGSKQDPAHELDGVYGGLLQPDGSILIGNSGTAELRLFARDGALQQSAGRMGRGPGEFQSINWIQRFRGDSILVFDMRAQRFSVWSASGTFGRVFRAQTAERSLWPVGVLSDGTVLVVSQARYDPQHQRGVVRDELVLSRMGPAGEPGGEVGRFPGTEWLLYEHPSSFRAAQVPLGRQGYVTVAGGGFVYASSDSGHLLVHDGAGAVVRRIPVPGTPRKLTAQEIRDALDDVQDQGEREAFRRILESNGGREAPRFLDLRSDRSGNLWIQLMPTPGGRGSKWVVMDLSGKLLGSVVLPASSLPLDIGSEAMLVRETDEDGVQRVSVQTLAR